MALKAALNVVGPFLEPQTLADTVEGKPSTPPPPTTAAATEK